MTFELGLSVGLPIVAFIFMYIGSQEKNEVFKLVYQILGFGFITASMDIFRKIAVEEAMPSTVTGMFDTLTMISIVILSLMIILFFLFGIKTALELWIPKKKNFSEMFK